jgi:hypothetical protein
MNEPYILVPEVPFEVFLRDHGRTAVKANPGQMELWLRPVLREIDRLLPRILAPGRRDSVSFEVLKVILHPSDLKAVAFDDVALIRAHLEAHLISRGANSPQLELLVSRTPARPGRPEVRPGKRKESITSAVAPTTTIADFETHHEPVFAVVSWEQKDRGGVQTRVEKVVTRSPSVVGRGPTPDTRPDIEVPAYPGVDPQVPSRRALELRRGDPGPPIVTNLGAHDLVFDHNGALFRRGESHTLEHSTTYIWCNDAGPYYAVTVAPL